MLTRRIILAPRRYFSTIRLDEDSVQMLREEERKRKEEEAATEERKRKEEATAEERRKNDGVILDYDSSHYAFPPTLTKHNIDVDESWFADSCDCSGGE